MYFLSAFNSINWFFGFVVHFEIFSKMVKILKKKIQNFQMDCINQYSDHATRFFEHFFSNIFICISFELALKIYNAEKISSCWLFFKDSCINSILLPTYMNTIISNFVLIIIEKFSDILTHMEKVVEPLRSG